jgi:hypothetical protein
MRCITIHQPWAWAIMEGHKRVENRTWRPPADAIGTRIAIHAGKRINPYAWRSVMLRCKAAQAIAQLPYGMILGTVVLAGVVTESGDCPWFVGPFGWLLDDPVRYAEPVPARGRLGLWRAR